MEKTFQIDFVVLWVDGNNPEWLARRKQYRETEDPDDGRRFREWGLLPCWFRAVEKYASWVNKVYFVTSGELPDWLNLNHPKLVHVKHEDFIPAKYLPTFSSRTIELNIHLIPGLSEHFVYFNDDMYLNGPIKPTYFFRKGLPCDAPCESLFSSVYYSKYSPQCTPLVEVCNVGLINGYFNRYKTIKQSPYRWFGPYLGFWNVISAILISRFQRFQGFRFVHQIQPYLKITYQEAWKNDFGWLDKTCSCKFKPEISVNHWFLRYWQLAKNRFYPSRHKYTYLVGVDHKMNFEALKKIMLNEKYKWICLNDFIQTGDAKENEIRMKLCDLFYSKFPGKSSFEK